MKNYPKLMGTTLVLLASSLTHWPTCWSCGNYFQLVDFGAWYIAIGNNICQTPCRLGPDKDAFTPTWEGGRHWLWLEIKQ